MDALIEKWKKLPEWARWILCWPILILATILASWLIQIVTLSGTWRYGFDDVSENFYTPYSLYDFFQKALSLFGSYSAFFVLLYYLVPRVQDIISVLFLVLFLIVNLFGIFGHFISFQHNEITFLQFLSGSFLMLGAIFTSVYWVYKTRQCIRNSQDLLG